MHTGQSSTPRRIKDHYPYSILHKITSFFHYSSSPFTTNNQPYLQDQKQDTATVKDKQKEIKDPLLKRILVVDDEPDVTLTFKVCLDGQYYDNKIRFKVCTYNDPLEALSEFKAHFYDLMLIDVYMPHMNGFELSQKILEIDVNIRVCFMSAAK